MGYNLGLDVSNRYLQFKGADVQYFFVFNILQKLFFLRKKCVMSSFCILTMYTKNKLNVTRFNT